MEREGKGRRERKGGGGIGTSRRSNPKAFYCLLYLFLLHTAAPTPAADGRRRIPEGKRGGEKWEGKARLHSLFPFHYLFRVTTGLYNMPGALGEGGREEREDSAKAASIDSSLIAFSRGSQGAKLNGMVLGEKGGGGKDGPLHAVLQSTILLLLLSFFPSMRRIFRSIVRGEGEGKEAPTKHRTAEHTTSSLTPPRSSSRCQERCRPRQTRKGIGGEGKKKKGEEGRGVQQLHRLSPSILTV